MQCNACCISEVAARVQEKQRSPAVAFTGTVHAAAVVSCSGAASTSAPGGPPAIPHATGLADGPPSDSSAADSDGVHAPSPRSSVTGADSLQVRPPQCPSDSRDSQDSLHSHILPFHPRLQHRVCLSLTFPCHRRPHWRRRPLLIFETRLTFPCPRFVCKCSVGALGCTLSARQDLSRYLPCTSPSHPIAVCLS